MENFLNSFLIKPTLFSILCSLIIIIGTPLAIYWNSKGYEEKLGATYLLFLIVISIILLLVDRMSVAFVKPMLLSISEVLFLFLVFLFVSNRNKQLIVNLDNYQHNYFMTILNNGKLDNSPLTYSFPFNRSANINGKHIIIDSEVKEDYNLKTKPSKNWKVSTKRVRKINGLEVIFQYNFLEEFDDSKIDLLIREELELNQ